MVFPAILTAYQHEPTPSAFGYIGDNYINMIIRCNWDGMIFSLLWKGLWKGLDEYLWIGLGEALWNILKKSLWGRLTSK